MTAIPEELFNRDGAIYMGAQRDPAGCQVGLFGVPYDGTTSFRPGTRFGPAAIRQVSDGLETYDPQLDADLDDIAFADLGAVEISIWGWSRTGGGGGEASHHSRAGSGAQTLDAGRRALDQGAAALWHQWAVAERYLKRQWIWCCCSSMPMPTCARAGWGPP